jgi:HlyD family secretion protein
MTNVPEAFRREPSGCSSQSAAKTTPSQPIKAGGPIQRFGKALAWVVVLLALAGGGYFAWLKLRPPGLPEGFASGNGRIEATEIDIDAKIPGRIQDVLVDEGDFVSAGQMLVHMDTKTLEAQRRFRKDGRRTAEVGVAVYVLNRILELGRPISIRTK